MRWSWLNNPAVALVGLLASAVTLGQAIVGLMRWGRRVVKSPVPLSIRLADAVDSLGVSLGWRFRDWKRYPRLFTASRVPLTTWLQHPGRGLNSYRRHLWALREAQAAGLR